MAIGYTAREDHVSGGGDDSHRRNGKAYQAEGGDGPHVVPGLAQNSGSKVKLPLFDDDTEVDRGNRHVLTDLRANLREGKQCRHYTLSRTRSRTNSGAHYVTDTNCGPIKR